MVFENIAHCRDVLRFIAAYLRESGYPEQSCTVNRAVTEINQELKYQEVLENIAKKNAEIYQGNK